MIQNDIYNLQTERSLLVLLSSYCSTCLSKVSVCFILFCFILFVVVVVFKSLFSLSLPVGGAEERRNLQRTLGELRQLDEHQLERGHLHIQGE